MPIPYHEIYSTLYERVTGISGADVRALLGGASSVFPAEQIDLRNVSGRVFPWLVWRAQPVGGESGGMRDVAGSWWVYDAPQKGTYTLHQIASALEALYGAQSALDLPYGRLAVTHIGQPVMDDALNARGLEVRIGYRRLG